MTSEHAELIRESIRDAGLVKLEDTLLKEFDALLAAQSEPNPDDRCEHCKEFDKDGCPSCGPITHAKVY